jgi:16S rRNA (cytosine1402-N4)-methyltransferase
MVASIDSLSYHKPALLKEVLQILNPRSNNNFVDATLGDGGHALAILDSTLPNGRLLGLDADDQGVLRAFERLKKYEGRLCLKNYNFSKLEQAVSESKISPISGILFDLGVSSWQLDSADKGFSFTDNNLDMRFNSSQTTNALDLINNLGQKELSSIIYNYGEDPNANKIARAILKYRPIISAKHLTEIIQLAVPRRGKKTNPATRTFQSLRIAVNNEMDNLELVLSSLLQFLNKGTRIVIIAYHSLEDRIVKNFMRKEAKDCLCPTTILICQCDHKKKIELINKRVIKPQQEELFNNPRVRSARLRACEVL